jgi:hypothetical protein
MPGTARCSLHLTVGLEPTTLRLVGGRWVVCCPGAAVLLSDLFLYN